MANWENKYFLNLYQHVALVKFIAAIATVY